MLSVAQHICLVLLAFFSHACVLFLCHSSDIAENKDCLIIMALRAGMVVTGSRTLGSPTFSPSLSSSVSWGQLYSANASLALDVKNGDSHSPEHYFQQLGTQEGVT